MTQRCSSSSPLAVSCSSAKRSSSRRCRHRARRPRRWERSRRGSDRSARSVTPRDPDRSYAHDQTTQSGKNAHLGCEASIPSRYPSRGYPAPRTVRARWSRNSSGLRYVTCWPTPLFRLQSMRLERPLLRVLTTSTWGFALAHPEGDFTSPPRDSFAPVFCDVGLKSPASAGTLLLPVILCIITGNPRSNPKGSANDSPRCRQ